ncbi:hypothetical protein NDU88_000358 [Pleurodeles waltl]|uniref:Uncharacterized protein n=1 Tax=Pleurodeles waltl TaxID=8319 RepID=A0AAV7P3Y9_PLEWA|nr:hypothetical protein NDU88_000358 [Pleurodeles waltl]
MSSAAPSSADWPGPGDPYWWRVACCGPLRISPTGSDPAGAVEGGASPRAGSGDTLVVRPPRTTAFRGRNGMDALVGR